MIGVSLRDGGHELLGQRRGLDAYRTAGKTMGIPFLHPWANRLSQSRYSAGGTQVTLESGAPGVRLDPNGLPIHGLLAASPDWHVEPPVADTGDERTDLTASFHTSDRPDLLTSFPFPHEVEIAVTLDGRTLTVRTTVIPTSDRPVPLAFGFHPYLQLPGVSREEWDITLPALRHRPVDPHGIPTGAATKRPAERFVLGDRTFDDGYDQVGDDAEFVVAGPGRRITVRFDEGYPAAQIFAPRDDAVICFEPMAAPTNALVSGDHLRFAQPGHPAVATFSITVDRTD
jgi:galactose mutarotase-like enzyme